MDGVLLASPHERAWREALSGLADPARFTTALYQAEVAGKPRMAGALAALEALGVADAADQVDAYAERKQARLESLIADGQVAAFPDALRFVAAVSALGWPMAVASSSKNANAMLERISLPDGRPLLGLFTANVCGRDVQYGKPNPELFPDRGARTPRDPGALLRRGGRTGRYPGRAHRGAWLPWASPGCATRTGWTRRMPTSW